MPDASQPGNSNELSDAQVQSIRCELELVVSSGQFAGSKRCQEFLRLIVDHALAGEFDQLRERMIGVEMFGRRVDYDTPNDSVVRVRATEVRRRLSQYYAERDGGAAVRIELPSGSYVPRFSWKKTEEISGIPVEPQIAIPARQAEPHPSADQSHEPRKRHFTASSRLVAEIVACVIVLCGIGYFALSRLMPLQSGIHSIAILPLQNLSGDPKEEYFADGMTEELITDLGQISALRVISRTSAMTYKGTRKTLPEIARALGVDAIVEGSAVREGDQVRITAQLIDGRTDHHIWARSYTRGRTSVLELQGEVAQEIADAIRIQVTPQEQARLSRARPVKVDAQEQYLLGMHLLNQVQPREAVSYFQKALAIDPAYAEAHAALADSYSFIGQLGFTEYSDAFLKQKAEASKAVELDDALPAGHLELANAVEMLDWDWVTAESEFKRALELNPNEADAHWAYCFHLERVGRIAEALAETKVALQLDPVSGRSFVYSEFAYYFSRHYGEALAQIARDHEVDPDSWNSYWLGAIYAEKGMYTESVSAFQKQGDQPYALGHRGNALARAGRAVEARAIIPKLEEQMRRNGVGAYEIALVYSGFGEKDQAFAWLEKSYAVHDKGLLYLKIDPCLDPLRSDPRFDNLVRRVGFPA